MLTIADWHKIWTTGLIKVLLRPPVLTENVYLNLCGLANVITFLTCSTVVRSELPVFFPFMISVLSDFERIFPPNLHTIMLHLLIEVHRNISNLGPAFYYWEFVMERFLSTLSRKIHDRGHPEINLIRNHTLDLALQRLGSLFKEQLSKVLDSELTKAYFEAGPLQPAQPTPAVVFPYSCRSPRVNPPDTAILLLYEWLQDVYNPANGNASISIGSLKACTFRICIRGVTVNGFKRLTEDAGNRPFPG